LAQPFHAAPEQEATEMIIGVTVRNRTTVKRVWTYRQSSRSPEQCYSTTHFNERRKGERGGIWDLTHDGNLWSTQRIAV